MIGFFAGSGLSTEGGKMKNVVILVAIISLIVPVVMAQETEPVAENPDMGVAIGGEIWGRYLHLNLQHWREVTGERLPKQDLFYYGGCSLWSDLRWIDAVAIGRQPGYGWQQ